MKGLQIQQNQGGRFLDFHQAPNKRWLITLSGDLANRKLEASERSGIWQGSYEELRCCLFFEQMRWHHFGTDPAGDQLINIHALFLAKAVNDPRRQQGLLRLQAVLTGAA